MWIRNPKLLKNTALNQCVLWKNISLPNSGIAATHTLFADDMLLFCKASIEEIHQVKNVLILYESASNQQVNPQKSSAFFNTNPKFNEAILKCIEFNDAKFSSSQLGIPLF